MVSEKFPQAFNRFKASTEDISGKKFSEVIDMFREWQREHCTQVTEKQKHAIAECMDTFISDTYSRFVLSRISTKGKIYKQVSFRDKKTGKFTDMYGSFKTLNVATYEPRRRKISEPSKLAGYNEEMTEIIINPEIPERYKRIKMRQRLKIHEETEIKYQKEPYNLSEKEAHKKALLKEHEGLSLQQIRIYELKLARIAKTTKWINPLRKLRRKR